MENNSDNKQKWDIIFAVLLIIGLIIVSVINNYKKTNIAKEYINKIPSEANNSNIQPTYEPKDVFQQDIDENIVEKLYSLGFVDDTSDRCILNNKCFKKDRYFITYSTLSTSLTIYVDGTKENINKYDYKKDFELIDSIYDKHIEISDNAKKLINEFDRTKFHLLNIETDGMRIHMAYYYDGLEYIISPRTIREEKSIFKPISLDVMISSLKDNKKIDFMKKLYDISMENNKQYFKYNDYFNVALNNTGSNLCSLGYVEGSYNFSSSFCHGGTSDAYYRFDYVKRNLDYDQIKINYKSNYFRDYYLDVIKKDLDYFSKKLNTKLTLSTENTTLIKDFMNKEIHDTTITISPKVSIDLEMVNFSVRYYYITYNRYK